MNTYFLALTLVNPSPAKSLSEYKDFIESAAEDYNFICSRSKHPKKITLHEIRDTSIILELTSSVELPTPGKSLRSFSQILIQNSEFAETFTFGKQLFTSAEVATDLSSEDSNSTPISADAIPDSVFLYSLIDYYINGHKSNSDPKKKNIDKMKLLAYECGLVKLSET